jgi:predicted membrane channel-forming protein YqfA (hemolysin III family)
MERNWDPGVKKFFLKILNSISWGLIWMLSCAAAGIYFEWGFIRDKPAYIPILFYTAMAVTLLLLVRYLLRLWKNDR